MCSPWAPPSNVEMPFARQNAMACGLMPVRTQSAHWIADPRFAAAIEDFLGRETEAIDGYVSQLEASSPFREAPPSGGEPTPG